jgi:hypothetical protein
MNGHPRPHALVVYESMFGSTRTVAQAVAAGLTTQLETEVVEVGSAPPTLPEGLALLLVAGPTHAFGLSRKATREQAAKQTKAPLVSQGQGLREWLDALPAWPKGHPSCAAATVDTRLGKRWVPGSAARGAQRRLRRKGFRLVVGAESFWVPREQGALLPGERERAEQWARTLAAAVAADHASRSWVDPSHTHHREGSR